MATVIINKNDTIEFFEGDAELAEKYAAEIDRLMDMPGVTVELGEPRGMAAFEIVSNDDVVDVITEVYMYACDRAVNDWGWAEG